MKNIKKISKALGIYLAIFSLVFSNMQGAFAVTVNESKEQNQQTEEIVKDEAYATGANPLTEEDKKWMEENMITSEAILPNKLGLERSNEVREEKGLEKIDESTAVKIGDEVIPNLTKATTTASSALSIGTMTESATTAIESSYLPSGVDNSELPFFPEIRSQGQLNSCGPFSTTYYQATYMTAMARGWDVKNSNDNSKIFSPKWTFNLANGGENSGVSGIEAYKLFMEQGIATWSDFPYNGDDTIKTNYLEWPTNKEVWEKALSFKLDKSGYETLDDGTNTPVRDEKADSLVKVKQLLSNGYVLTASVAIDSLKCAVIKDDTRTTQDNNKYFGKTAAYMATGYMNHSMAVVGYNDDIWVDINSNDVVDIGEKGAFKLANSWGADWNIDPNTQANCYNGDGFIWVCYDALNTTSVVENIPVAQDQRKAALGSHFYWMTAKTSNTPSLSASIDITYKERNQLKYELGYSDISEITPTITWIPTILNKDSGAYSFNGLSNTESQGAIALDYSDIIKRTNIDTTTKRWYVRITTNSEEGLKGKNIDFKINSNPEDENAISNESKIYSSDGKVLLFSFDYALKSANTVTERWSYKNDNSYTLNAQFFKNIITYNNKLYMYDYTNYNLVEFNSSNNTWSIYDENWPALSRHSNLVYCDGKIYVFPKASFGKSIGQVSTVRVYNIETKAWDDSKKPIPEARLNPTIIECDGKIYVIGGSVSNIINGVVTTEYKNSVFEYDPSTDTWTTKASMRTGREKALGITVKEEKNGELKGQIYYLSGFSEDGFINTIEKYDPIENTSSEIGTVPVQVIGTSTQMVNLNGKIYCFSEYNGSIGYVDVYEYKPVDQSWTKIDSIPINGAISCFAKECNNRIYVMPDNTRNLLEFNPLAEVKSEGERVGIPYFSVLSGSSSSEKTVKISCFTSDATIIYTTYSLTADGLLTPTSNSTVYTGPINVTKDTIIKAIAIKDGMIDSYGNTAYYKVVPKPVFIISGSYKEAKKLTMSCIAENTVIKYTTNGIEPDENSATYTEPINIIGNVIVKAIAIRSDKLKSEVTTEEFKKIPVIGDVSGDNEINFKDQALMGKYIIDPNNPLNKFPIEDEKWGGDLNGDGLININDLNLIKAYIASPDKSKFYFPKEIMPLNVSLKATAENSVTIGWDDSLRVANIVSYAIYRDDNLNPIGTSDTTSYTDTSVIANTDYKYTVVSVLEDGTTSNFSIPLNVKDGVVTTPILSLSDVDRNKI